jgi:hypothetical protein
MSDERLNTAIDEVAKEMTSAAPGAVADLRRQVVARIESGDSPRRTWRATFLLTAIAAGAAIIVTLFVARERRPGRFGPGGMAGPLVQTLHPLPAADAAGPKRPALQMTPHAAPRPVLRRSEASGPGAATTTPVLEPNTVASIAVAPLAVDTLTPESIHIEQLETIAPILVAPLDIIDSQRRDP